jgi:hypothetical protein
MRAEEVKGLMEAYSQVYETPEVSEEIVKEVEAWVNSLVEEGHDLSEYTWEDMCEFYLNEAPTIAGRLKNAFMKGVTGYGTPDNDKLAKVANLAGRTQIPGMIATAGRALNPATYATPKKQPDYFSGGGGFAALSKGKSFTDVVNQGMKNMGRPGGVWGGSGSRPGTPSAAPRPAASRPAATPSAAPRPAAPRPAAPRPTTPAATAAPKPTTTSTPTKPATGTLGSTSFERRTPTSAELKAAQTARASGASAEKALQAAKLAGTAASVQSAGDDAAKKAFSTPSSSSTGKTGFDLSKKNVSLSSSVDIFDLVKGHLLDEGYADTEENALVIMANMSEEWRNSIVEAQKARENPEGHDKEEKKKYEPVRGERTPMPPRGDKRREDFEKWYAANVR